MQGHITSPCFSESHILIEIIFLLPQIVTSCFNSKNLVNILHFDNHRTEQCNQNSPCSFVLYSKNDQNSCL